MALARARRRRRERARAVVVGWHDGGAARRRAAAVRADAARVDAAQAATGRVAGAGSGHELVFAVHFKTLPGRHASPDEQHEAKTEPFGFVDGISQPLIRGSYKALRAADPIHLVEAGEFVLGYPDNRGYISPGPTLDAIADPGGALPIAAVRGLGFDPPAVNDLRDLGRNGTFLAIRQLEQDVESFWQYCAARRADDRRPVSKLAGRHCRNSSPPSWSAAGRMARHSPGIRTRPPPRPEGDLLLVRAPAAAGALPATNVATARPAGPARLGRHDRSSSPTTTSCSAPKIRRGCAVRSAPTSAARIRARASIPDRPSSCRSPTATGSCASAESIARGRARTRASSSCA